MCCLRGSNSAREPCSAGCAPTDVAEPGPIFLGDGAELRLATGHLTDRTGRLIEGVIMPDDSLTAALATSGLDRLTTVALEWLSRTAVGTR